jgi:hypothetical protein
MTTSLMPYNGYLIKIFKSPTGRWRMRIRRQDGHKIVTSAGEYETVTSNLESGSPDDAVMVAKTVIDVIIPQDGASAATRH